MQDLYADKMSRERIASFLLDLALQTVKSDAGTFYTSSLSGDTLEFTAVIVSPLDDGTVISNQASLTDDQVTTPVLSDACHARTNGATDSNRTASDE